ncbi:MAG: thioredoxin, partial [Saprospiraceae bacterium]
MDFQQDVIERSFSIPVVVDFWAPWCGPCRVLTPVIEQLAAEQAERWVLVKINTEEFEDLARKYQIQSIPNVKMFYRGEVYHEFLGALPKTQIQEWLRKVLPSLGLIALDQLLKDNDNPEIKDLEALLEKYPESNEISFVLSQILLWEHPSHAAELLSNIKMGSPFYDKANHIRDIASFLLIESPDTETKTIIEHLQKSNLSDAIPEMIRILSTNKNHADGKLHKATIGIFNVLGNNHPLSKEYRKK